MLNFKVQVLSTKTNFRIYQNSETVSELIRISTNMWTVDVKQTQTLYSFYWLNYVNRQFHRIETFASKKEWYRRKYVNRVSSGIHK